MREMDLVLGQFADSEIGDLAEGELAQFEALLDVPDNTLIKWITGEQPVDEAYDTALFKRIRAGCGAVFT